MALIECTECGKEYSEKAKACPNCGCPTISNTITEKRKRIETCSVNIKGNETLIPKTKWISIFIIIIPMFAFWATMMSIPTPEVRSIFQSILGDGNHEASMFIIGIVIPWFSILLSSPLSRLFPEYKKRKREAIEINNYFKKRFLLLDTIPENISNTKIVNTKALTDEEAMFNLYMEAYKYDADSIVINDSNVSTHVVGSVKSNIIGGGVSGSTTSSNTFHITATLVKY